MPSLKEDLLFTILSEGDVNLRMSMTESLDSMTS